MKFLSQILYPVRFLVNVKTLGQHPQNFENFEPSDVSGIPRPLGPGILKPVKLWRPNNPKILKLDDDDNYIFLSLSISSWRSPLFSPLS